ncbi:RING-H2 finger protein ATL33-like [Silene latifolia]|uniref:RING-H2 finger protein ATL33-like n=1 Tax=Silene latifolia TaxID=37657 RepID=UPI003D7712D4
MSPYSFLIMLLIMVMLPTLLYTFFFLINCPPTPCTFFRRRSVNSGDLEIARSKLDDQVNNEERNVKKDMELIIMSSELGKEEECPVCLSIFVDGEELRQLKTCKHLFHKGCIDKWLSTHFNCPICRAFIITHFKSKPKGIRVLGSTDVGRSDLWQGLPDSSGLV